MNESAEPIPTTVKEVGIHIGYMRQEAREIKADIHELKVIVQDLPNGFAQIKDLSALESRVVKLENRENIKNTLLWVGLVASAIINIVALYDKFTQ